jgi:hypothetical protein
MKPSVHGRERERQAFELIGGFERILLLGEGLQE